MKFITLAAIFSVFTFNIQANAESLNSPELTSGEQTTIIAQAGDNFDPFADYSEFEESSEEEADINFFKNGRFFTLGFMGGQREFTAKLQKLTTPSPTFGLFFSYFFDLRFALQFSFATGQHKFKFTTPLATAVSTSSSLTQFGIAVKYYLNTQNVTRGLASLNPYLLTGFSQVTRTASSNSALDIAKDSAMGFDVGGGIEVPIMRNRMYLGATFIYHLISFKNEGSEIEVGNEKTGIFPTGDVYSIMGVAGINF